MPFATQLSAPVAWPGKRRLEGWRLDVAAALACTLLALAAAAAGGFAGLHDSGGDNDSLLRLVEVRDLMQGQGWFDLHQYRMGLAGGFVMHWSRLVDAPLAGLMILAQALGASPRTAEAVAALAWPLALYTAAMICLARGLRFYGRESAFLPGMAVGAVTLNALGPFAIGDFDHHNLQLVLTLGAVVALLGAPAWRPAGLLAGTAAALMLAVGAETVPYVGATGLAVALLHLFGGEAEARLARHFGIAFGGIAAIVFFATVRPAAWGAVQCDAFSVAGAGVAALAGFGLAAASLLPGRRFAARLGVLTLLGLAVAALVVVAFPECLGDPYGGLDPRLRALWLDGISEAQPFTRILVTDPVMLLGYYATPLVALAVLGLRMLRRGSGRADLILAGFLAVAFAVSLWQVRGALFSLPLAVLPLAEWIGSWRDRANAPGAARLSVLRMALAWLASINLAWSGAAASAASMTGHAEPPAPSIASDCLKTADYAGLNALPPGTVLAISNLGSSILAHTGHRSLAGPYHRNVAGNVATLDAELAGPAEAERIARAAGADYVAICPGNSETASLVPHAPEGLLAALVKGDVPAWLEPAGAVDGPLRVYRIRP